MDYLHYVLDEYAYIFVLIPITLSDKTVNALIRLEHNNFRNNNPNQTNEKYKSLKILLS